MPHDADPILNNTDKITISEFRKLLFDLKNVRPDIQIRYRLLGDVWHPNFVSISNLPNLDDFEDSKLVVLHDDINSKKIVIENLADIVQFEIESPFGAFRPHFHYYIRLI